MRILFMGTSSFAVPSLKMLLTQGETLVGVFTQPDRPRGRGRKMSVSPVKALALQHGLSVYQPEKINRDEPIAIIQNLSPELIVVVAFGQIISQRILAIPKHGSINVHASLLPCYRGAGPINWAIINGEKKTGVTTMFMDPGLDSGDILMQREVDILPEEHAGELHDRLAHLGAEVLRETIEGLQRGKVTPRKQDEAHVSYAPLLKKEDGLIDWQKAAETLHNHIRGMDPWPGAYTYWEGKILKIFKARTIHQTFPQQPGTILEVSDKGILVGTGVGGLLLTEIQLENHKRMSTKLFLQGHPLERGTRLG